MEMLFIFLIGLGIATDKPGSVYRDGKRPTYGVLEQLKAES